MQAAGADIMRLTMMGFEERGLDTLAPMHDGFLLTCRWDELPDVRAKIDAACETAVAHVLPGFKLRWDMEVHEGRYRDDAGAAMWDRLAGWLTEVAQ